MASAAGADGESLSPRTEWTRTHKLTVDLISRADELYDVKREPHELRSLFKLPGSAETQAVLESYLPKVRTISVRSE